MKLQSGGIPETPARNDVIGKTAHHHTVICSRVSVNCEQGQRARSVGKVNGQGQWARSMGKGNGKGQWERAKEEGKGATAMWSPEDRRGLFVHHTPTWAAPHADM